MPDTPVCPICSTTNVKYLLLRQSHANGGWRCPHCLLAFPHPPGAAELKRCPECARRGRIQVLSRLDWGWQWCPVCNYSEQVLTAEQMGLVLSLKRKAVGGCYGEYDARSGGGTGGGNRPGGKKGRKGKPGRKRMRPLHLDSHEGYNKALIQRNKDKNRS